MTYSQVLRGLAAGEEANLNRVERNDNRALAEMKEQGIARLKSISNFSNTLDQFIQKKVDKQIEDDKLTGKLKAIEEDLESKDQTGTTQIPEEDVVEYNTNKTTLIEGKKDLNNVANDVLEKGGSFQEASQVSNLSGWALYSYVQQKSKIAADNYQDWLKGEMINNESIQLEVNGKTFTPSTAETLDQKSVAIKALRRQYIIENNLLDVNRALLDDPEVGFYDKVQGAHSSIMKQFTKDDAIEKGFEARIKAKDDFVVNKNFAALLGDIKITADKDGNAYTRAEALDEAFDIMKDAVLNGEITLEQLQTIKNEEIIVNGEKTTVGRWKTRWRDLETELAEEAKAIAEARLDQFDAAKKNIEADWKELEVSSEEPISDEDKAKYIQRWITETGEENPPSWMNDYLTAEDNDDVSTLDFHLDTEAGGRGYLIEADLYGMSKAVQKEYKNFIKSDQDLLKDNAFKSKADRAIKAQLKTITGLAAEDSDAEYDNALTNAEADYENEYLNALEYTDPEKAHQIALQVVKDNFAGKDGKLTKNDKKGVYFKKKRVDPKKDKEAFKEMREVWDHIEKADPDDMMDYIKTNKLPHVDEHLELARDYKKKGLKTIPDYFKRIARKFPDIQAWDIMDAQLKLDQKKKGEKQEGAGEPQLDVEILKDETLKDVNKKLTYKPNQYSIYQAGVDILDTKKYLDSTDDEYSVFKSTYNTDQNLIMPGINLSGV